MIISILKRITVGTRGIAPFILAAAFITMPLLIPSIATSMQLMLHWIQPKWLIISRLQRHNLTHCDLGYDIYSSVQEEARYWESALLGQNQLKSSCTDDFQTDRVPVITSYKPALLPYYRKGSQNSIKKDCIDTGPEYYLSARTFCKWHRMVSPGSDHPTIQQASKLRRLFSNRDLREMYRISRLVSDEKVFGGKYRWTPKYRNMWRKWQEEKGPDIAVIFA